MRRRTSRVPAAVDVPWCGGGGGYRGGGAAVVVVRGGRW